VLALCATLLVVFAVAAAGVLTPGPAAGTTLTLTLLVDESPAAFVTVAVMISVCVPLEVPADSVIVAVPLPERTVAKAPALLNVHEYADPVCVGTEAVNCTPAMTLAGAAMVDVGGATVVIVLVRISLTPAGLDTVHVNVMVAVVAAVKVIAFADAPAVIVPPALIDHA
jgi:hypothetical protein